MGSLGDLLNNRLLYRRGVYWGEVHRGEQEPIIGRDLFEAVQTKIAANAVARQVRLKGSPALLTGRIFDDRGNRMSPTHANKPACAIGIMSPARFLRGKRPEPKRLRVCLRLRSRRWCLMAFANSLPHLKQSPR